MGCGSSQDRRVLVLTEDLDFDAPPAAPAEARSSIIRWKKGQMIGKGAYGTVYMAMNEDTGQLMAMKEVVFADDDGGEQLAQVCTEINMLLSSRSLTATLFAIVQMNLVSKLMKFTRPK